LNHEQLIGRAAIEMDLASVRERIEGRSVLVTGAAGFIGSLLAEALIDLGPANLVLLDRSEQDLHRLSLQLSGRLDKPHCQVELVLGDLLNTVLLAELLDTHCPDIAFHAAAYKHVGLLEGQPLAVLENNVIGTHLIIKELRASSVRRLVLISSDKAVQPQGIMGASKRLAELLVLSTVHEGLRASAIRLGNVLGSRGSVLPRFEHQLRSGQALTVSDPEATRYFALPSEAVGLTLQALVAGEGRDILVAELGPPVRILDLAERLLYGRVPDTAITFTGLLPGEKRHEELVDAKETLRETEYPALRRIVAPLPEPMAVNAWACRLANYVQQRDVVGAIDLVREVLPSYSPSDTILSLSTPAVEKARP
jgi:FlaA1/EpsC-like NDP-sugar epimerase